MDISSIYEEEDRISQLPNDVLLDCLSLLDLKNAAQTSILSKRWRYLWTHLTKIDFDPQVLYPEEYLSLQNYRAMEAHKYFACVKQVITAHRGPTIHKLRIESRCNFSNVGEVNKWVKFALAKRVRVLVLHGVDPWLIGFDNNSRNGYPFGFFLLTHPSCYNGITSLQSLSLCSVNVTGEFLEFLLSHCHQLERLFLDSTPLFNFRVKTSKLKYLTILMSFCELEELEIYAENLLHFEYEDGRQEGGPRIVFKNVPMLVGAHFRGAFCNFPFPIFEKLSSISNQLTKLSIRVRETYDLNYKSRILSPDLVIPAGVIPCFPNLKQFIFTVKCRPSSCVLYLKRFLEASPLLEEFKLQVEFDSWIDENRDEAKELQKIDFKDEKDNVETEIDVNLEQSYPKLRVLELVGFLGVSVDVQLGLFVLSYARRSLETIICDTKGVRYTGIYYPFDSSAISEYDVAERRAHKLSKIVAPKVKTVLDVGTGSEILAIWAAQAGARKVYAVEATKMSEHARHLVKANGLETIVEVIQGSIEDVFLPEKVDVIISEWMGYFLLRESMFDSVICARDRWLKPTGVMYPSHARMWVAPIKSRIVDQKMDHYEGAMDDWSAFVHDTKTSYGVDMSVLSDPFIAEQKKYYLQTSLWNNLKPEQVIGTVALVQDIDCLAVKVADILTLKANFSSKIIEEDTRFCGFGGWFDVQFRGRSESPAKCDVELTTEPSVQNGTHWGQQVFLLDHPFPLGKSDTINASFVMHRSKENHRLLEVEFGCDIKPCYGKSPQPFSKKFYIE